MAASRKSKARLEQRVPLKGLINYPGQIARIKRYREPLGKSASGAASGNDCTDTSSPYMTRFCPLDDEIIHSSWGRENVDLWESYGCREIPLP